VTQSASDVIFAVFDDLLLRGKCGVVWRALRPLPAVRTSSGPVLTDPGSARSVPRKHPVRLSADAKLQRPLMLDTKQQKGRAQCAK
jgi:hypothetical protein